MRKTAAKIEAARLGGPAKTDVNQTESRAKPAADTSNLAQFARQMGKRRHSAEGWLD